MIPTPEATNHHIAYLSLGGNMGDVAQTIKSALEHLGASPKTRILACSDFYKTPPWGKTDQPDFINACAKVETSLPAQQLLEQCLEIERQMGRERIEHWGPRVLDMDILTFDDQIHDSENLTIPHPHMMERAFVLIPLLDIAPDLTVNGTAIVKAANQLDTSDITRL